MSLINVGTLQKSIIKVPTLIVNTNRQVPSIFFEKINVQDITLRVISRTHGIQINDESKRSSMLRGSE